MWLFLLIIGIVSGIVGLALLISVENKYGWQYTALGILGFALLMNGLVHAIVMTDYVDSKSKVIGYYENITPIEEHYDIHILEDEIKVKEDKIKEIKNKSQ